ncbi:hypothetical protein C0J52_06109 [Blattella germanica]|nr:hypothetical protein C0J52_06109 [Blattella germanica]
MCVLVFQSVTRNDSGIVVVCSAVNPAGSVTWRARLTVTSPEDHPPPIITLGPTNQTLPVKSMAVLPCSAIGSPIPIELFGREPGTGHMGSGGWVVAARRIQGPTYTQYHLAPGVSYTFLVRAENSHGLSPPSPLSEPVTMAATGLIWPGGDSEEEMQLNEARANLLAGHVVELVDAQSVTSTSVKLVWEVVVRGGAEINNMTSRILTNVTVNAATPSLLLTNLTAGVTYIVQASAATRAGPGPPSAPATLRLDPTSRLLLKDQQQRQPVGNDPSLTPGLTGGDFLTETWFIALLGSMVAVMVLLFAAMLLVRRRQLLTKKSTLTNLDSRSNGGVLATPLSLKSATGLPHPLTTPTPHSSLPHDSSLWIENRPNCWRNSENSDKDSRSLSESRLLHNGSIVTATLNDYAETGMLKSGGSESGMNTPGSDAMPAYAEVDQNHSGALTTFQGLRGCNDDRCGGPGSSDGSSSPAPYATTTLVGSSRQHLNGLGWVQICPPSNDADDQPYPSNSACFFGRNVYSDTYFFSGRCNDYGQHSGGSMGVPASINNCKSRKAMSELGHRDNQQQPSTGNTLSPPNPPPSSASVPHTPAGTLRRGHRNLQLIRPQMSKCGMGASLGDVYKRQFQMSKCGMGASLGSNTRLSPTSGMPHTSNNSNTNSSARENQRFSDPPPDVINSPNQPPPQPPINPNRTSPLTTSAPQSWKSQHNMSGVKPMLLMTSIPSGTGLVGDGSSNKNAPQLIKDLPSSSHPANSYNAHSLSSFAVPYHQTYAPSRHGHGQYQPVYHQSSRSEPGGHHNLTAT